MADKLQANVERLAADRETLRRFIADASHELRTPLTALKSFNALLLREGDVPRPEEAPASADLLRASAEQIERLDALTQGLLDLSRLDAALSLVASITDDLRPLVERSAAAIRPLMAEKGLTLTFSTPAEPVTATHDPVYLRRAVDNLLNNALKFTPAGGQIQMGMERGEEETEIWVQDDGPGVPADELPQIFHRFFRGRVAAGTEGSGLGLAIVKAVAQAHGGRVEATSPAEESAGTRVSLFLPTRT
jgi:signal transduction histidine kinase